MFNNHSPTARIAVSANYRAELTNLDLFIVSLNYLYAVHLNTLLVWKMNVWQKKFNIKSEEFFPYSLSFIPTVWKILWSISGFYREVSLYVTGVSAWLSRRCTQTPSQQTDNLVFQMLCDLISYQWSVIFVRLDCHLCGFIIRMYPVIIKAILN